MKKTTLKRIGLIVLFGIFATILTLTFVACSSGGEQQIVPSEQQEDTPSTGHTHSYSWSCNDLYHWQECVCGEQENFGRHTYGEWIVDEAATEERTGLKHRICSVCGKTETKTIDRLEHSFSSIYESNDTHHWQECACGEKQNYGPHTFGDWIVDCEPTIEAEGSKHRVCSVCRKEETANITRLFRITYTNDKNAVNNNPTSYVLDSTPIELLPLSKGGYIFDGWYLNDVAIETVPEGASEDLTITAKWTTIEYQIDYVLNGGEAENVSNYNIESAKIDLNEPIRFGYDFLGWTTLEDSVPKQNISINTGSFGDLVYTANWTPKNYNINYELNGGVNNTYNPATYTIERSIRLNSPTKFGHSFVNWSNDGVIPVGSFGDKTFVASWELNNYAITYDLNGGTIEDSNPSTYTVEDEIVLKSPSRVGYTFAGWFNGKTLYSSGKWSIAQNITLTAKWTPNSNTVYKVNHYLETLDENQYELIESESFTGISDSNITPNTKTYTGFVSPEKQTTTILPDGSRIVNYYYSRESYSIVIIGNGGTNKTMRIKYQSNIDTTDWTSREGFTLGGLFTDSNLTVPYTDTIMPSENKTVYAYWMEENRPTDFTYTINNSAVTITGFVSDGTEVAIPTQIGGNPVTTIADNAFEDCVQILSVIVPNSVTSIGRGAFKGCSLTSISIPFVGASRNASNHSAVFGYIFGYTSTIRDYYNNGSKDLNSDMYYSRSSTEFVDFQYLSVDGTTWQYSCYDYYGVSKYTISSDNYGNIVSKYYRDYVLQSYFYYIPTTLTSVIITDANIISEEAFYNCNNIENISLNDGVSIIGTNSFENCTALKNADIGNGIKTIKEDAFRNCTSLTSIKIPDFVKCIEIYAFYNNTSLSSVILQNGLTNIGDYAFYGTTGLKSIILPSSLTRIGDYAFYGTRIRTLNIPLSVNSIGAYAFAQDYALTGLTVSGNVGDHAFDDCINVTSLILNDGIETIGEYAFQNLSVTSLVVPNSVTSIGQGALKGCDNLTSISVPFIGASRTAKYYNAVFGYIFGIASVFKGAGSGDWTFSSDEFSDYKILDSSIDESNCVWQYSCHNTRGYVVGGDYYRYGLKSYFYYIPSSLTSIAITDAIIIPEEAFFNCANITNISIINNVTTIDKNAFRNCLSLENVNIGTDIITINENAFKDCSNLTSINLPNCITTIKEYAFYNNSSLSISSLPDDLVSIGDYAFCMTAIEINLIPDNVNNIGNYSFSEIDTLTSVTIPHNTHHIGIGAFFNCTNINSITLNDGIETIGEYAFQNLSISSLVVPNSVTSIGQGALKGCDNLTSISVPFIGASRAAQYYQAVLGYIFGYTTKKSNAVYNCEQIASVSDEFIDQQYESVSGTVWQYSNISSKARKEELGEYRNKYGITSYYYFIPTVLSNVAITGTTLIPEEAFFNCTNITNINLNNNITTIDRNAFKNCSSLSNIIIPYDVSRIGANVFANCSSADINCQMTEQPNTWDADWNSSSCPVIWGYGCESGITDNGIKWVSIDGETVRIHRYEGNLSNLAIPSSINNKPVTTIDQYAFKNITTLNVVEIPSSITSIQADSFEGCLNLSILCEALSKPAGYANSWDANHPVVWGYAGVSGITDDGFKWALNSSDSVVIYGYSGANAKITIPTTINGKTVYGICESAFRGNTTITSIFIPACVEFIGAYAFSGCTNLKINCEAASLPSGWASTWKDSSTSVYWSM